MVRNPKRQGLEIPVSFNGVSVGTDTARLGIKISRESLSLESAGEHLCGKQLTGKLIIMAPGDSTKQRKLVDDLHDTIEGTFTVKGFSVSTDMFSTGLTFLHSGVDLSKLPHFVKKQGRLIINEVQAVEVDDDDDDDDDAAEE